MPDTDFWQPWTPQPGQRVRVRLSGECRLHDGPLAWVRSADGMVGTVIERREGGPFCKQFPGHVWAVLYDRAIDWCTGATYAAAELEPDDA